MSDTPEQYDEAVEWVKAKIAFLDQWLGRGDVWKNYQRLLRYLLGRLEDHAPIFDRDHLYRCCCRCWQGSTARTPFEHCREATAALNAVAELRGTDVRV